MDALKRIVRNYNGNMEKLQYVDMSYLHPAQRWRLRRRLTVERPSRASAALRRASTRRASATRTPSRCSRGIAGLAAHAGGKRLAPEQKK